MDVPAIGNAPPITPVRRAEAPQPQERPQQPRAEQEEERPRPPSPEANRGQNVDILA